MRAGRGPTLHTDGPRGPWIETHDGRELDMFSAEGLEYAESIGVRPMQFEPRTLSNTPRQDHHADACIVDPRPIRPLNDAERAAFRLFIRRGAYAAVAGFETWRARDRWLYIDVLGVGRDEDEAEQHGMPVGPIDERFLAGLRVIGEQLALRMLDPNGHARGDQ